MRISSEAPTLCEEGGVTLKYAVEGRSGTKCVTECPNKPEVYAKIGSHTCTQCRHFVWRDLEAKEVRCIAGI
jgi:hypothetical protein